MKLNRKDYLVSASILGLIAILLGVLFYDLNKSFANQSGKQIAKVVFKKNLAQRKSNSTVIWADMQNYSPIYNLDSIRTDESSEADIILKDGTTLAMGENSLIFLNLTSAKTQINLSFGSLRTKSKGKRNIELNSGNKKIILQNGQLKLSNEKDEIKLNVGEGQVQLADSNQIIKANHSVTLSKDEVQIKQNKVLMHLPQMGQRFITARKNATIKFHFSAEGKQPYIEIAKTGAFSNLLKTKKSSGGKTKVRLPPGLYHWRIRLANEYSTIRKFHVIKDEKLKLFYPKENIIISQKNRTIQFAWSKNQLAFGYELTISSNKKFAEPIQKVTTFSNSIQVSLKKEFKLLANSTFYYRVKTLVNLTEYGGQQSKTEKFTLKLKKHKKDLRLLKPADKATLSALTLKLQGYTFSFSQINSAVKVQIADQRNNILFEKESLTNYVILQKELPMGQYRWRVGQKAERAENNFTPWRTFKVSQAVKLKLLRPKNKQEITEKQAKQEILFSWQSLGKNLRYRLSLKDDNNKKIQRIAKTNSLRITLPIGRYTWNVALLSEEEKIQNQSENRTFTISNRIQPPKLLWPRKREAVNMNKRNKLRLKWRRASGADSYLLRLKHVKSGKIILETKVKKEFFVISDLSILDVGKFRWSIQSLRKSKGEIEKSKKAKASFYITLGKTKRPKITSAKVHYIESK